MASAARSTKEFLSRIAVLLCGTFGTALLAFATQIILTRSMAVPEYGRLAALLAAVNVLTPFALIGIGWYWLELFGREGARARRWIAPALRLALLAGLLSTALLVSYVLGTAAADTGQAVLLALLIVPVLLGQSLAEGTAVRLQLEERYFALAAWQSMPQLGRAVVALALLALGSVSITGVVAGYALVAALISAVSLVSLEQVRGGRIALAGHAPVDRRAALEPAPSLPEVLGAAAPYCLVTLFYLIYSQGIVAMVNPLLGSEAAGIYNVAFLITAAVYLIPNVVYMKYLASKILRWWSHDRAMFNSAFHLGVATHLATGVGCGVLVGASASWIIPALFGSRYVAAVPVLWILALGIPVRFVQHSYGSALFSKEHIGRKIRYMGCAAAASVVLTALLAPMLGVAGAAAAAVLSELLLLALYVYGVARHVDGLDVLATFRPSTLFLSFGYVRRHQG